MISTLVLALLAPSPSWIWGVCLSKGQLFPILPATSPAHGRWAQGDPAQTGLRERCSVHTELAKHPTRHSESRRSRRQTFPFASGCSQTSSIPEACRGSSCCIRLQMGSRSERTNSSEIQGSLGTQLGIRQSTEPNCECEHLK